MKKLNLFLLVAGFFAFTSCSGILENQDVQQKAGNVIIKINDSSSSARFISPVQSFDISQVKKWTLTFTPITPVGLKEKQFTLEKGQNSVTLGVGTYSLYIEGSYEISNANGGSSIVKLSGTRTNITVTEGKTTQVAVAVGLKKTAEGTGTFAIGFKFNVVNWHEYYTTYGNYIGNSQTIDYTQGIKILLISKDDNKTVYSTEDDDYLKIQSVDEQDNTWIINVSTTKPIPAGYYYIEFYADYSKNENSDQDTEPVWRKVVLNTDNLVEIADDQETIGDFADLNFPNTVTEYVYYASKTGSTESNGLSKTNPGNLYTILENIYANNAVSIAKINYTYPDSDKMEFDVSKVQRGKQVTISYSKDDVGDSYSLTIDEAGLITFYNTMNEELSLITTNDKVKSFNVKDLSGKVCLNNGVYLDFSSFEGNEQSNIYFDVDDVEYYKKNPMVVSSVSFKEKPSFFSSDSSNFTYDIVEKENSADSSHKYYYAEEPVSPIVYYSNKYSEGYPVQYWIQYKENNTSGYNDSFSLYNKNFSLAAFCDDYNGGLYAFEFKLEGDTNNIVPSSLTNSSGYELVHFVRKKTDKSTEFTLEKNNNTGYIKQQIPASMCTDGSRLYFVNTAATITGKAGKELLLSSREHWAYENATVYSVDGNSGQSASEVQLNFDSVFTKVTAVYCQGKNKDLYIAGYKTNKNGSTRDSTYCIYKLANPQNYKTDCSITAEDLTKVSELFTTSTDSSFIDWCTTNTGGQSVYAFNAITDMAIIDNNLYVLKNSYYFANANNIKITSSLIRINNNGQIDKTWSTADNNGYQNPFMVARKFIAVLPKKKKLLISENASTCYYTGDFSNDDLGIVSMTGSVYAFDGYDITPNGFISGKEFKSEADFIENVSSN